MPLELTRYEHELDAVRGIVQPVRIGRWNKPKARTKARTSGWKWAGVNVIAFRKGTSNNYPDCDELDHITAAPVTQGRRAELPPEVAAWMVRPFAVPDGAFLDPFAGSGVIVRAAESFGMRALGFERQDEQPPSVAAVDPVEGIVTE